MYPLRFKHLYFEKIWGGRGLESFRYDLPDGNIGESWDIACHQHGTSIVANGKYEGLNLDELIKLKGEEILGSNTSSDHFPLLVKLISTKQNLSVQVHPDDEYASRMEGETGKTEAWYIVEASEGSSIIIGCKECTKQSLKSSIDVGQFAECMNKVYVKKGEVYFIKSGLIHAIGEGVIIAEIQQNSDTTYRVYDYDRGRDLHINKALDVINLGLRGKRSEGLRVEREGYSKTFYCLDAHFALDVYDVETACAIESDKDRFNIITCVEGDGEIKYSNGNERIKKGDSYLIPASLGKYEIIGRLKFINSYVPNIKKVEKEILSIIEE
ncbi:MAG: class I mannose-6-phosphate isomerase [Maledivibacter sp.]|jgi:mannose-6-phosphate isomerase|nr:class I mannose-6-phosphate isomerase [Maledivibacter sp.]